jgi:hypothetical protein
VLVCALLALLAPRANAKGAAARSASSASGGSSSTATGAQIVGSLAAVLDTSPAAIQAKSNVVAQVSPVLQGITLRCAGARMRPSHARELQLRLRASDWALMRGGAHRTLACRHSHHAHWRQVERRRRRLRAPEPREPEPVDPHGRYCEGASARLALAALAY